MRPLPFLGGLTYALIFWTACALWILPEAIVGIVKRSSDSSRARDKGSLGLILVLWWLGIALDFAFSFFLPQTAIVWERNQVFFVGIGLMLAGVALRWYSASVLGKYFTFDVAIQGGQTVIEAGPYKYVRHPS